MKLKDKKNEHFENACSALGTLQSPFCHSHLIHFPSPSSQMPALVQLSIPPETKARLTPPAAGSIGFSQFTAESLPPQELSC